MGEIATMPSGHAPENPSPSRNSLPGVCVCVCVGGGGGSFSEVARRAKGSGPNKKNIKKLQKISHRNSVFWIDGFVFRTEGGNTSLISLP